MKCRTRFAKPQLACSAESRPACQLQRFSRRCCIPFVPGPNFRFPVRPLRLARRARKPVSGRSGFTQIGLAILLLLQMELRDSGRAILVSFRAQRRIGWPPEILRCAPDDIDSSFGPRITRACLAPCLGYLGLESRHGRQEMAWRKWLGLQLVPPFWSGQDGRPGRVFDCFG